MKKLLLVFCLLLIGCSKKPTLKQLKNDITHQSNLLYTEVNEYSQIESTFVNQMFVLDSLLETESSFIILVEPKQEKIEEVKKLLQQLNPKATLFSNKSFVALVLGEDTQLVQQEMQKLETK